MLTGFQLRGNNLTWHMYALSLFHATKNATKRLAFNAESNGLHQVLCCFVGFEGTLNKR